MTHHNRMNAVTAGVLSLLLAACSGATPSDSPDGGLSGGDGGAVGDRDAGSGPDAHVDQFPSGPTPVVRGGTFMGVAERFNRYYTDPDYSSSRVIYVSRTGSGDGSTRESAASVDDGFAQVKAGEQITFVRDTAAYAGCWQLDGDTSGTYDAPIVLYAERNDDGSRGVHINCCDTGRSTCFNLEFANYVAVDGFELEGGTYGIRAVGAGYDSADNQRGIAMLNNHGFDQCADPFFTGQSSWTVVEGNLAHGAGECDGHGIYLSNGGDWMIVRGNNLHSNSSSDLQINADPISTCADEGMAYDDPRCDGSVHDGLGRGVSEFVLVENNYLHHGDSGGPNFTSMRNSVVRNNVIGPYARHGTSFWQETDNPNLGSSGNAVHHNLFMGNNSRHLLQLVGNARNNDVRNNLLLGIGGTPVLVEVDGSSTANTFRGNYYAGGGFDGHSPGSDEHTGDSVSAAWFVRFPAPESGNAADLTPTTAAPFVGIGERIEATPRDLAGAERPQATTLGPLEP